MKITGDIRCGSEFKFVRKPNVMAASTFIAVLPGELRVTRRFSDLADLPDETPVVAHWHGTHRTDAFACTVLELKEKSRPASTMGG